MVPQSTRQTKKMQLKLDSSPLMNFKARNLKKLEEKENNVRIDDRFLTKGVNRMSVRDHKGGKTNQIGMVLT